MMIEYAILTIIVFYVVIKMIAIVLVSTACAVVVLCLMIALFTECEEVTASGKDMEPGQRW